jgi:putative two-component system hydrogenase maturation factor HypX/HoxX
LEDSKKQGEDGWSNINAMNDLLRSVLSASDVLTVASLEKNAGAGGVFLALACDYAIAKEGVVLNPHYKTLGLSGSEYHTYTLPKRVGEEKAKQLLDECLPISAKRAFEISMIDKFFEDKDYLDALREFANNLAENIEAYNDFLYEKEEYLSNNLEFIEQKKEEELRVMYSEFWDKKSSFHQLRYDFVYKACRIQTPKRLKSGQKNICGAN